VKLLDCDERHGAAARQAERALHPGPLIRLQHAALRELISSTHMIKRGIPAFANLLGLYWRTP
jgi:hypothetical protein